VDGGISQTVVSFALAAIPGVIVLELLEYGRPRVRDRSGVRAFASYLILSLIVWVSAFLLLDAGGHLASAIDPEIHSSQQRVDAYAALAWRLLLASIAVGLALRALSSMIGRYAYRVAERKRRGIQEKLSWIGDALVRLVSLAFAWDRLLERLRRSARPQIVHVRFRDGSETYGVLAGGGRVDFQADGRGMVLDAELVEEDGQLVQIPDSNGVFIAADAVASVGFVEYFDPVSSDG
jgi:hypothetical protein